jgi:hypothetical protein
MTPPSHATSAPPAVSVVMAVYNGEQYVRLAIESVLTQDFRDFELVIVDDCSTDATPAIIAGYADLRIVYVRNQANLGQTPSLNAGLALSRAPLVARIDADDVFLPGKLRRQYEFMQAHPEVAVCGTSAMRIDAEGAETGVNRLPTAPLDIRFRALRTVPVCHVSVMMRRDVIVAAGGYAERYRYAADFALWSRLLRDNQIITNLPDVLVQYRECGETFGAAQKVGAAGDESAEIIAANVRALAGQEVSLEDCRAIALLYFPAAGATVSEIGGAVLNLQRLAACIYGQVPRHVSRTLAGSLFWSVTKRLAYLRAQPPGQRKPGGVGAALKRFLPHPGIAAVVLAAAAAATLGERRVVTFKETVMLRGARSRRRRS